MRKIMKNMAVLLAVSLVVAQGSSRILAAELPPETESEVVVTEDSNEMPAEEEAFSEESGTDAVEKEVSSEESSTDASVEEVPPEESSDEPPMEETSVTPTESETEVPFETMTDTVGEEESTVVPTEMEESGTEMTEELETGDETESISVSGNDIEVSVSGNSLPLLRSARSTEHIWDIGNNITATLSSDGTLTVSGNSYIAPESNTSIKTKYWHSDNTYLQIKKIVIEEGITSSGEYKFAYLPNLVEVQLPATLTVLGRGCFYDCTSLKTINLENIKKWAYILYIMCH